MPLARLSFCLLLLFSLNGQAQEKTFLPDFLTTSSLNKIIEDAKPTGMLPPELKKYPRYPMGKAGTLNFIEGKKKTITQIVLTGKISRNEFLVYELKDETGKLIQTDIIRFHYGSQLYHRWQLLNDDNKTIRILIGRNTIPPIKGAFTENLNRAAFLNTMWREAESALNSRPREKRIIQESYFTNRELGMVWDETVYENNQLVRAIWLNLPSKQNVPVPTIGNKKSNGLFSRLFGKGDEPKNQKEVFTFEDRNFTFQHPGKSFYKVDAKTINPSASLMFSQVRPPGSLTIIAEVGAEDLGLTIDGLFELSKGRLKRVLTGNPTFSERTNVKINDLTFTVYSASQKKGSLTSSMTNFLLIHNGFVYQIIYSQAGETMEESFRSASEIIKGFKLIDPARRATLSGNPSKPYSNPALGINFDPAKIGGSEWSLPEIQQQFPTANYGTLFGREDGVILIATDLQDLNPSDDALASAFSISTGIEFATIAESKKTHLQGSAEGFKYESSFQNQGTTYTYRLRVLRNKDTACLVFGFILGDSEANLERMSKFMDLVEFTTPQPLETRLTNQAPRKFDDKTLNRIGLYYLKNNQITQARQFFIEALTLNPEFLSPFNNLITSYTQQNDPEGALAFLKSSKNPVKESDATKILTASLYHTQGAYQKSHSLYREVFKGNYRNDDDLLSFLNLLSELNYHEEALAVIDRYLEQSPSKPLRTRRWQHQVYSQAGKTAEALKMAQALAKEFPKNPSIQNDLIQAFLDDSKSAEALPLITVAIEKNPNDSYLHYQKGLAFHEEKQFQKAKESFESALKLAPNTPLYSDALAYTSAMMGQGDQLSIREPLDPVTIPAPLKETLDALPTNSDTTGFSSISEKIVTGYHFKQNKPLRRTEYRTIKILNQAGVNEYKSIRFTFDPTFQRAFINEIKTLDEQGKVLAEAKLSESYVSDNSAQVGAMATTESTVTAPVPGLRPGCLIQYSYTIEDKGSSEFFPFEFSYFATFNPSGPKAIFVTGDIEAVSAHAPLGLLESNYQDTFKSWHHPSPPRYHNENSLPPIHRYLPSLALGSKEKSWGELSTKYLKELKKRLPHEQQINALAKSLTKGLNTPEEKASALIKHVQSTLSYQALEFGTRARIPNTTKTILKNNYGDCKDHSLLAYQLFQAAGIPASLTLVHNENPIVTEFPSLDQFNHMILFAPDIRGGTYFDATDKQGTTTALAPNYLAGEQALVLTPGNSKLQKIPEDIQSANLLDSKRLIKADPEKNLFLIEETLSFEGAYYSGIRSYLRNSNSAEHKSNLEAMLGSRIGLSIDKLELQNLNEVDKPLVIKMTYTIEQGFEKSRSTFSTEIPALWEAFYLDRNISGQRKSPFYFSSKVQFTSTSTLKIPDSFTIKKPAWSSHSEKAPSYESKLDVNQSGDQIKHALTVHKGMFPKEQHSAYTKGMSKIIKQLEGSLILEKKVP